MEGPSQHRCWCGGGPGSPFCPPLKVLSRNESREVPAPRMIVSGRSRRGRHRWHCPCWRREENRPPKCPRDYQASQDDDTSHDLR